MNNAIRPTHIVFRVDAGQQVGTGHVMRCLVLAHTLRRQWGEELTVTFLCAPMAGHLADVIAHHHFAVRLLPRIPESERDDAMLTRAALPTPLSDWLIVDHYQLSDVFERLLRPYCTSLMVIDDLADRVHDCDLLLDQNLLPDAQQRYADKIPATALTLLGPRYALLRDEFYQQPPLPRTHLLVFFGGADQDNVTAQALRAITELQLTEVPVDVVLGAANPWVTDLQQAFAHMTNIHWHINCDYMAKLMARARFSLGAGGGTHWERALLAVPSIVMTVADNQRQTTACLQAQGACVWLGDHAHVSVADLKATILHYLADHKACSQLAENASRLVPKQGGARLVVDCMQTLAASE